MKPKLSIIVPVYNVRQYLNKCVDSILAQTFRDFELIIVDDGSIDGSGEICDEYAKKDSRIKVIHQQNAGQSCARNFGIKFATGDYIGFSDSDDWIEPEMYEKMLKVAETQKADIVICRLQTVSEKGKDIIEVTGYKEFITMDRWEATREILKDDLMRSYPVNKIYRRSLFRGITFPLFRYFEDTSTIYKLIYKANKIVTTPYIGYNYRLNPNSTCNNTDIDYSKKVKREYDNALAFGERYMFCKQDEKLSDVKVVCANKAYMRIRSFIHLQAHKNITLTSKQEKEIDTIMNSFELCDLECFSWREKIDFLAYKYCKPMLMIYLKILSIVHPLSRDL